MFLAVDIGNTNITLGFFDGDNLIKVDRIKTDSTADCEYYQQIFPNKNLSVTECGIISVVEGIDNIIKQVVDEIFKTDSFIIDYKSLSNMNIKTQSPENTGIDRIINAYGAKIKYKTPMIIVDVGTAITLDVISKDGDFLGGAIMPGINIQLKALSDYTSRLPNIKPSLPDNVIGNNTENAILSGVINGIEGAIKHIIGKFNKEIGRAAYVIFTGGQAEFFFRLADKRTVVEHDLTIESIKTVYQNLKKIENM